MADFSKLGTIAQRQAQSEEDKRNNRLVALINVIERRLINDPHDDVIEAIEIILHIKRGDLSEALTKLGVQVSTSDDESQPALPAAPERPLPVYDADGERAGVALREEQAIAAGYGHKLDGDGNHIGWQKPPTVDATTVTATTQAEADREVDLRDKKGRVTGQIKVADGAKDSSLEAVLNDDDGTVKYFQKKARILTRRS